MHGAALSLPTELVSHPVTRLDAELHVAADKSISHRALLLAAVAAGRSRIDNLLESADCLATLEAVQRLGAVIERPQAGCVEVEGRGLRGLRPPDGTLDCGNSGTAIRLLAGLLAGQGIAATLSGDASLRRRPMERIAEPLRAMGAGIQTDHGRPPIVIEGTRPLHGIDYRLPVASAQVKSALLLAALNARGTTRLREPGGSRDHTERMLTACGVALRAADGAIALDGPVERLNPFHTQVPGDFSSAAFWLVAAALAPQADVRLLGVGVNPTRTGLLDALQAMGAGVELQHRRIVCGEPVADLRVQGGRPLHSIELRGELIARSIDELPVLFVAAACAEGITRIRDAAELRHKESDRLTVMAAGLDRLGIRTRLHADGIDIVGGTPAGGSVDSTGDHRVAMSFAVAAVRALGPVQVRDTRNIATSYPTFVADAGRLGLRIETAG